MKSIPAVEESCLKTLPAIPDGFIIVMVLDCGKNWCPHISELKFPELHADPGQGMMLSRNALCILSSKVDLHNHSDFCMQNKLSIRTFAG